LYPLLIMRLSLTIIAEVCSFKHVERRANTSHISINISSQLGRIIYLSKLKFKFFLNIFNIMTTPIKAPQYLKRIHYGSIIGIIVLGILIMIFGAMGSKPSTTVGSQRYGRGFRRNTTTIDYDTTSGKIAGGLGILLAIIMLIPIGIAIKYSYPIYSYTNGIYSRSYAIDFEGDPEIKFLEPQPK
jgi:hypothetical protein